jgi:FAD/FMN-containing dehydrogenase
MGTPIYESLKQECTGEIILPGDAGYDAVRTTYTTQGTPEVVVRVRHAQDVAAAVRFAVKHGLSVAVRSGGHSIAGHGTNTDGMVIDCSAMNAVQVVDHGTRRVRIGTGATWKMVADALKQLGWALSSGDSTSVGVDGLTLGGGIGWMVRKYGLTIDNLLSAEIVTADGTVRTVSADTHPDLFWALRGGGGNFGVVTQFEFTAAPVTEVYSGTIVYATDGLPALIKGWRDHLRTAPDELSVMFLLMPAFFGNPPSAVAWCCYAGNDAEGAARAVDPLLKCGTVLQNNVVLKAYADVLEEPHPPEGVKINVTNGFVPELTDELVELIAAHHCRETSPMLQFRTMGGAVNRIDPAATAFAHRSSEMLFISATFLPLDCTPAQEAEAMVPWNSIAPYTSGAYVNFFSTASPAATAAGYPDATYERLKEIKKKYDPHNLFRRNINIVPG